MDTDTTGISRPERRGTINAQPRRDGQSGRAADQIEQTRECQDFLHVALPSMRTRWAGATHGPERVLVDNQPTIRCRRRTRAGCPFVPPANGPCATPSSSRRRRVFSNGQPLLLLDSRRFACWSGTPLMIVARNASRM